MRQIKFRVWNEKTKRWIHGPGKECNLFGEMILFGGFMRVPIGELNDCIALQYTGVNDKNGVEIYEGDLIKYGKMSGDVSFIAGMFVIDYPDQTDSGPIGFLLTKDLEVVGNIHEPPVTKEDEHEDEEDEEEDSELETCGECGEEAWDGYICHNCGFKII